MPNSVFFTNRMRNSNHDNRINFGERLLPQVVDDFAAEDPEYPIGFMMKKAADTTPDFTRLSISQLAKAINYMSFWLDKTIHSGSVTNDTISFIGVQDFRYWVMEFASMKSGRPILLPSTRNALPNTASLIRATNCKIVFYSGSLKTQAEALKDLVSDIQIFGIPELEQMIEHNSNHYPYIKTWDEAQHDVALIVHTSGSTGDPKPIYYTNAFLRKPDAERFLPSIEGRETADLRLCTPGKLCYLGAPFFHLSGIGFGTAALFNRYTIVMGPPDQPPSGQIVYSIAKALNISGMVMVPSLHHDVFINHGEQIKPHLKSVTHVCWLGGPLAQGTGDWIVNNLLNVKLWQVYATTETQVVPMLVVPRSHWPYMEFHPTLGPKLERLAADSDLYEIVMNRLPDTKPFSFFRPVFELFPGKAEWRSGDLVRRCTDAGFENLVKYEGRVDNLLILSNGLKVNPYHIESQLQSHPALSGSLVFGGGYIACGLLIEATDLSLSRDSIVEFVWPSVVQANSTVPEHAQIAKEKIILATSVKPFVRTGKGTIARPLTLKKYGREIAQVFETEI